MLTAGRHTRLEKPCHDKLLKNRQFAMNAPDPFLEAAATFRNNPGLFLRRET